MRPLLSPKFWLGMAASLFCLWLAVRGVPFAEFGAHLRGAHYVWLLPAFLLIFESRLKRFADGWSRA